MESECKREERFMINEAVKKLVCYGLENHLIGVEDVVFATNQILETLQIDRKSTRLNSSH